LNNEGKGGTAPPSGNTESAKPLAGLLGNALCTEKKKKKKKGPVGRREDVDLSNYDESGRGSQIFQQEDGKLERAGKYTRKKVLSLTRGKRKWGEKKHLGGKEVAEAKQQSDSHTREMGEKGGKSFTISWKKKKKGKGEKGRKSGL